MPDDPARRLHAAIQSVLNAAKGEATMGQVLESALGGESPAQAMGLLLALLSDVQEGLRSLVGTCSVESYLTLIQPLETWLSEVNLTRQWRESGAVDEGAHVALLACSDQLQGMQPLQSIDQDDLTRLSDEVSSLLDDILESKDLHEDLRLRRFLIASALAMRDALDDYRFRGSSHLLDVVERAAGAFATHRPRPESDEGQALWKRLVAYCGEAIIVMTFATTVPQLPANLHNAYEILVAPQSEEVPKAIEPTKPPELGPGPVEEGPDPEG